MQVLYSWTTWGSNAVASQRLEKALCQWKFVESPSHPSSMYTSCINFTISTAGFFNWQQSFIALLCSFFTSIFKKLNSRGVTKRTFTKIVVTRQWKVISRWNLDHRCRIDHRSLRAACLRAAMDSFAMERSLSYFWTIVSGTAIVSNPTGCSLTWCSKRQDSGRYRVPNSFF